MILVKVYFKYLNVKNESTLFVVKVIKSLNRKNFSEFSEVRVGVHLPFG